MRVLHYASRAVASVALLAFATGCSGDSTAPDAPFSAEGTSADVAAIEESFDAPAMEAYASVSADISVIVGGSAELAVRATPSAGLAAGGRDGAMRFAASLAKRYGSTGLRPALSAAAVPAEYLGATFVYDVETDTYVESNLTGAPGNGVRFLLYAVNPVTKRPVEPLVELGHVDITSSESAASATSRAVVVSGGLTYLDYTVVVTASGSSSGTIGISGFATNGTDRVDFDLDTELIANQVTGLGFALDYLLVVPTRGGFRMDIEAVATGVLTESPTLTLDITARGDHGTVTIQGAETDGVGSFEVEVNGDLFATITVDGQGLPVVVGATGQPLTEAERAAMVAIWVMFAGGMDFFDKLLDPIA